MKKILLFLMFLGSLSSYSQVDYTFVYNNDSIINKGISLYEKSKYADAIKEYEKIGKTDPKFLNALYEKALAMSAFEKNDSLKSFFEEIYNKNLMPKLPKLYTLYGSFLSDEKEYEKAEKIFIEGEKYLSNSSNFLYNFAILYVRKEEPQKSVDLLKRAITNNPNHGSSHYLLGALALDNGKIVEATLSFMSYLIIAPKGRHAEKAIAYLNAKFGQNYLEKNKLVFSKTGDNFEEIETILRNQLPLKKAYKINSEIDDVIIRQVQAVAEYTLEHKMGNGFFETTYIPWIKDIVEKKQFEGFSYYILLGMEEKIGKKLTSQKKKISAFYDDYYLNSFWNMFAKRRLEHFGKQEDVIVTLKGTNPFFIGPIINGKFEGKYKYLNEDGNLKGELNFENNELNGYQKYFDDEGKLTEEKTFIKGKIDGTRTDYYSNGLVSLKENYKNEILNGLNTSYYPNGGKQCEINFVNGERDGKLVCLYPDGKTKSESNYLLGKLNGTYTTYNEVGDLIESCTYSNDLLEGNYVTYYNGKAIKSQAIYSKGEIQGSYKKYFSNGVLEKETFFENGKVKRTVEYFANAKKSTETSFNDKEEVEKIISYDYNENMYFEEKYKTRELKVSLQYLKNNPKPVEVNLSKKPFVLTDFNGNQLAVGTFEKGQKTNQWNYYYTSGLLKRNENYNNKGKQNGLNTAYTQNGLLNLKINYANDAINGIYEVYDNGKLNQTYYYENDKQIGPYKTFYPDGALKTEGYFIDDSYNFEHYNYWQNGTVSRKNYYIEGDLSTSITYDNKGKEENTIDYKNKTGKYTTVYNNGAIIQTAQMINGELNGKFIVNDKYDNPIMASEYVNGVKHNIEKGYSPMGTIDVETNYYAGKSNGYYKVYDLVGTLRLTGESTFGDDNGKYTRYYFNKNKMIDATKLNDFFEGEYNYFNQKGEIILTIGYENNNIKYYIAKSKTGELNEKTTIINQTANITSNYPNGKTAIKINFEKGNLEGKAAIYSELGKPEFESNYVKNLLEGERIEYYPNGNVYKKERFKNNDYQGVQEYFKEDGKPWLSAEYKNDELHGTTLIYKEGKVVLTKKYDSDELVEIIK